MNRIYKKLVSFHKQSKPDSRRKFPQWLILSLTDQCNMQCPHCLFRLYDENFFSNARMECSQAQDILRYFYQHGIRKLYLVAEGEVLLYPYFREIVRFSKKLGFEEVGTFTNGILLHQHIECIVEHLDFIYISVDGYDNTTYAQHRGSDDVYHQVLSNIEELVKVKDMYSNKVWISIACVVSEQNFRIIDKMIQLAENLQVNRIEFYNFHAVTAPPQKCTPLYENTPGAVEYLEKLILSTDHTIEIVLPTLVGKKINYYCSNLFDFIVIGPRGDFSPCCQIPSHQKYGNFFQEPESYIVNEVVRFKQRFCKAAHPNELAPVCRECLALSPKNYIYFPGEQVWKKRVLINNDTFSFLDEPTSCEGA